MLPGIKAKADQVNVVNTFMGVNKGLHIAENEFADMQNMTCDYFPVLSQRKKRGLQGKLNKPQGILGGQYLAYVDDDKLYFDRTLTHVPLEQSGKERKLVMMGAKLCVFPDGIVYNTIDKTYENIKNETHTSGTVTFRMCKLDRTVFDSSNTYIGPTAPTTTYGYWLDTSQSKVILKMWSATYSMWTSVATTYVLISANGIGKGFKPYDAVKLSGVKLKGYNDYDFNTTNIVYDCDDDNLVVAGLTDLLFTQTESITASREFPKMDFICELDNRLWGCYAGYNDEGQYVNEIYACKQGDPLNWNAFAGLDSDSYAASVGTQGVFTGIVSYGGFVLFFKEEGFHKLYGTKPSNYEMVWKPGRGVHKGCDKSLAIVDEILFYKSRDAIVAYDGSQQTVSNNLGVETYYDAVGVGYRNKYYVSMRDADYKYRIYVYDVTKGTWVIEDDIHAVYMAYANNAAFIVTSDNDLFVINNEVIYRKWFLQEPELTDNFKYPFPKGGAAGLEPSYPGEIVSGELESNFEWSVTTGDLGLDNPYNKYLKRINVRMELNTQTKLKIEVEYDSSGEWEYVTEYYASRKRSYEIPIPVKRADHVRLRLSGWGDIKIFAIAKAVEAGSGETNES